MSERNREIWRSIKIFTVVFHKSIGIFVYCIWRTLLIFFIAIFIFIKIMCFFCNCSSYLNLTIFYRAIIFVVFVRRPKFFHQFWGSIENALEWHRQRIQTTVFTEVRIALCEIQLACLSDSFWGSGQIIIPNLKL